MMNLKKIFLLLTLPLFSMQACAQDVKPAFREEIQAFKKQDSASFPKANQILFVGSSSFTKWTDVQQYFPVYPIINRGFGGSTLTDVIRYANDIILPYQPKQIVIYCGENDFASDTSLMPAQVAARFYELFSIIRKKYKKVPVAYVSMKPSPSRTHLMAKYNVANVMIRKFLKKKKKTDFIDVYPAMLNSDGTPIKDIFVQDNLHMNKKGYDIWQKIIGPYLKK
ncbi:MAG: G-D-S-L family lipolytic protein [Rhizobacter sp.]|nr:G-D-S-L family lipolytic protein [Ferruginibacter sp.]